MFEQLKLSYLSLESTPIFCVFFLQEGGGGKQN